MTTHSSILAGKSHGQRSLVGSSPWGHKETQLSDWAHGEDITGASPRSLRFGHFGELLEDGGSSWMARTVCFSISKGLGSFYPPSIWVISHALAWLYKARVVMVTVSWQSGEVRSEVKHYLLSRVQLPVTPWTGAHQAPLSMEFFRQAYWSEQSFPSPGGIFLTQSSNPSLLQFRQIS